MKAVINLDQSQADQIIKLMRYYDERARKPKADGVIRLVARYEALEMVLLLAGYTVDSKIRAVRKEQNV